MLPLPLFVSPPEPLLGADETACDPSCDDHSPPPGVDAFARFVLKHQGGVKGRICGPCGGKSGHASGRAWDWMIDWHNPLERARADRLIEWLLTNDAEMFRRAGLYYIIWNKRIWSANHPEWQPYDGFDEQGRCTRFGRCRDPHTNHVHFSFHAAGAAGKTSFYDWLRAGEPTAPMLPRPVQAGVSTGPLLAGFAIGFVTLAFAANTKQGKRLMNRVRARLR